MLGRKFKSEFNSRKYIGFEEGTNLALDIILPPERDIITEMFFVWFIVTLFSSFILGVLGGMILGFICALIVLKNATKKINTNDI